jgi:hypothetical protein
MASTIEIFCCYASKDKVLLDELKTHIIPLQRRGFITLWNDADISPGTNWARPHHKSVYVCGQSKLSNPLVSLLIVSYTVLKSAFRGDRANG